MIRAPLAFLLASVLSVTAAARTLHVSASRGDDANDGTSTARALRTIQRAADLARAGDEVVIGPGVYFERVRIPESVRGAPGRPVVFRADRIERDRVVVTGADRTIREKKNPWEPVDSELGLYAVPLAADTPARVTYDHVDLFPYGSLEELKTFTTTWQDGSPGPRHGFYHDISEKRLYVRLHSSGRYGPPDPNLHVMAVSGRRIRDRGGFAIPGKGPAHLVFEGITFETPGDSAITTTASVITIRDCWFFGSPYAVRGNNRGEALKPDAGPWDTASEIVIEHCEFSEFSTWNDASELLAALPGDQRAPWSAIWHRKTTGRHGLPAATKNYENGIAVRIGRGWIIRHNHIHDIFEGLANDGMSNAVDVRIHDNVFARICDNAIETENRSRDVRIYRNHFVDVFEPFSWQPGGGPPWPGPIWFYQNVVTNTPEPAALWKNAPHGARGLVKMGISLKNWANGRNADVPKSPLAAPEPGLLFFNNTFHFPGGRFITLMGDRNVPIANVVFARNLIAVDHVLSTDPERDLRADFFDFRANLVASAATDTSPLPLATLAGPESADGRVLSAVSELGWAAPEKGDFRLREDSPAKKFPHTPVAGADELLRNLPDAGALQPGDTWFPPRVGPRVTSARR